MKTPEFNEHVKALKKQELEADTPDNEKVEALKQLHRLLFEHGGSPKDIDKMLEQWQFKADKNPKMYEFFQGLRKDLAGRPKATPTPEQPTLF